jgi:hypothetical protein
MLPAKASGGRVVATGTMSAVTSRVATRTYGVARTQEVVVDTTASFAVAAEIGRPPRPAAAAHKPRLERPERPDSGCARPTIATCTTAGQCSVTEHQHQERAART